MKTMRRLFAILVLGLSIVSCGCALTSNTVVSVQYDGTRPVVSVTSVMQH